MFVVIYRPPSRGCARSIIYTLGITVDAVSFLPAWSMIDRQRGLVETNFYAVNNYMRFQFSARVL